MVRKLVLASAGILILASCASKPKQPDAGAGGEGDGAGNTAPVIAEKEMDFGAQGSDSGQIQGLSTVFFEYDQARLTDSARQQLSQNADWIKNNQGVTVQIEGHTDERGSVEYNLSLGERRAKAVKQYLSSLGVDGQRMTIISYGEEKPLETGESDSAFARNRRANFLPLKQ